jgi:hypothetical protein
VAAVGGVGEVAHDAGEGQALGRKVGVQVDDVDAGVERTLGPKCLRDVAAIGGENEWPKRARYAMRSCRGATSDGSRGFQPTDSDDERIIRRGATIESRAMTRIKLAVVNMAMVQSSLRDEIGFARLPTVG